MEGSPVAILERLLEQPPGPERVHWPCWNDFGGTFATEDELAEAEEQFAALYRAAVAEVEAAWGPPDFSGHHDTPGFPVWCPASELSYWRRGARLACVWWEQQDNDAPVALVLYAAAGTEAGC